MTEEEQAVLIGQIVKQVGDLNRLLQEAAIAGMKVEVDIKEVLGGGTLFPIPTIRVDAFAPLLVSDSKVHWHSFSLGERPEGSAENPFTKEHWNVTVQGEVIRDYPEKAKELQEASPYWKQVEEEMAKRTGRISE